MKEPGPIKILQKYHINIDEQYGGGSLQEEGKWAGSGWVDKIGKEFESALDASKYLCENHADVSNDKPTDKEYWHEWGTDTDTGEMRTDKYLIRNASADELKTIYKKIRVDHCKLTK